MVDTKIAPRRQVSYQTLDEIVVDAERLVAAGAPTTGNWSRGKIMEHIARVMEMTVDGFPFRVNPLVRFVSRYFLLKRFLNRGMLAGFKPAKSVTDQLEPDQVDEQEALNHLRSAVERLKQLDCVVDHAFFGELAPEQARAINCRHAELHMSFISDPT